MIQVLDSTLREGEQTPGVCFHEHTKLALARRLDEVGVDIIEVGHPVVTPRIRRAVEQIARQKTGAIIAAHARTCREDVDAALECGVGMLGLFYCVSADRLTGVVRKDIDTAVELISETIRYARSQAPELLIRYTPEDAVRSPFENVVRASVAAVQAGADIISVADTTGFMIPGTERSMGGYVRRLKDALRAHDADARIAVHCHNDRGLALANSLDAIRGGAEIVDAAVLGLGERAGITDLAQLLYVLQHDVASGRNWELTQLPSLYEFVSQHVSQPIPVTAPYVGRNAFTHCAGVHTHAATKNPAHYQSVDPAHVGRTMEIALDHMSGMSSIRHGLFQLGITDPCPELLQDVLAQVRMVGETGRTVDQSELREILAWRQETINA